LFKLSINPERSVPEIEIIHFNRIMHDSPKRKITLFLQKSSDFFEKGRSLGLGLASTSTGFLAVEHRIGVLCSDLEVTCATWVLRERHGQLIRELIVERYYEGV